MNALITTTPTQLPAIVFSDQAELFKEDALASSGIIGAVRNAAENETATEAQRKLRSLASEVEKARKAAKAPLLEAGRALDAACESWLKEVKQEELRVAALIGDYQAEELKKLRAEQARIAEEQRRIEEARQAELRRIAEEEQAAIKAAKSKAEAEAVAKRAAEAKRFAEEEAAARAEAVRPATSAPVRADGQRVRPEWEILRINDWALCKARPDLVRKIEFDLRAIKDALSRGEKLPGVEAREVVRASVVAKPGAIDI